MQKNQKKKISFKGDWQMKEELFGSILYDGQMINVDQEDIENLKKIAKTLTEKNQKLEEKAENIFKQ